MHDINKIREEPSVFVEGLKKRGLDVDVDNILQIDKDLRARISDIQKLQEQRNQISKDAGKAKSEGDEKHFAELNKKVQEIKDSISKFDIKRTEIELELNDILSSLPNIPSKDLPVGEDDNFNIEIKKEGKVSKNKAPHHYEIGEELNELDFETASELSGSRFVISSGSIARLERALSNFMIDIHINEHGYKEINVPYLVKKDAMFGTGQLPKFSEDQYKTDNDLWLIPTAEVPLTNLVRKKIFNEEDLPLRFTAFSQCFRKEAGAAGKDTRGMIRLHQFPKVELVSITKPNESEDELERMLSCAEKILKLLELPYRVVLLSTGDIGFSAHKTYDLEVWFPSEEKYREISSCSNCLDFQARRMNSKYKNKNENKNIFLHTLNGSGVAVGRALAAILENHYDEKGLINIPEVLRPYMNDETIIKI
tara:strand:- start:546 stop:1817 length:1272 start_codon:yes stop_codon:yes gene_type:complete